MPATSSLVSRFTPITLSLCSHANYPPLQPSVCPTLARLNHRFALTTATDPPLDGSDFMGERLVVQFARGSNRPREYGHPEHRAPPRPRRTVHRMSISGLPFETSWQVSNVPSLHTLYLVLVFVAFSFLPWFRTMFR